MANADVLMEVLALSGRVPRVPTVLPEVALGGVTEPGTHGPQPSSTRLPCSRCARVCNRRGVRVSEAEP